MVYFSKTKTPSMAYFKGWQYPKIEEGKPTKYNWLVQGVKNLKLGKMTDIGAFTYIDAKSGVIIEDFVQISAHCALYSTSTIDQKEGKIVLKRNCKIGAHCVIMPGVTIGENSIVGAFSFVNQDIPANSLAHGIPVKVVRKLTKRELKKSSVEKLKRFPVKKL